METPGAVIRRLRKAHGWTQPELAALAKVSIETVVRAERGGNIRVNTLHLLARVFDPALTVALIGGAEGAAKKNAAPVLSDPVWSELSPRLSRYQRDEVYRFAHRLLGEWWEPQPPAPAPRRRPAKSKARR